MDYEKRLQRLLFRSHHRGFSEMDLLMGGFAEAHLAALTPAQLDQYEAILNLDDLDVFAWATESAPLPPERDGEVMRLLIAYQRRRG